MASTQTAFDLTASTYDANRARLIPCYERFYQSAVDLIPSSADHILDLGAGTGLLSTFVRSRFPEAYLHMIDNSPAMLDQAKERFAQDRETVFEVADYVEAIESRGYAAIVSALSIHHLQDEAKKLLFAKVIDALKPGGVFINAEQVSGPTPELELRYKTMWLEQVRAAGATPEEITNSLYRQQEDRCASVENQLGWMRDVGFRDADCWFKDGRFAVLAGTRLE